MRTGLRLLLFAFLLLPFIPHTAHAQTPTLDGIVAFIGQDTQGAAGNTAIYLMDMRSGAVGRLDAPVNTSSTLAWQPDGELLAFTTDDGGVGLLNSITGCFDAGGRCLDDTYIYPPFMVNNLAWMPDGSALLLSTDEGLVIAPPRPSRDFIALELDCPFGLGTADQPSRLYFADSEPTEDIQVLCATGAPNEMVQVNLYQGTPDSGYTLTREIGTYPAITALAIAYDGGVVVGTLENGGDSAFSVNADGYGQRLTPFQIHVYTAHFAPNTTNVALVGATADSTGDNTLRDGDSAELFVLTQIDDTIRQIPGFTGITNLAWSPDSTRLLAVLGNQTLQLYTLITDSATPLPTHQPPPGVEIFAPTWHDVEANVDSGLPVIPTATPA
ncbi:MAG: hypothetical protein JXQ72_05560, partial [Anaerolineae bacterium]|nr:hypothetical protein [Anaerolineae bacterium]